ncbi:MAG TPA: hypothetical protein VF765_10120 [Polyangiaceae bacterium]
MRTRERLHLRVGLALALSGAAAHAAPPPPAPAEASGETPSPYPPVRVGAIAGMGFPRPFAMEAIAQLWTHVAVGLEYGIVPGITVDGVRVGTWSLAGDARWLPWRGPFFVGLRAGVQHVEVAATLPISGWGPVSETLGLDASFVNPRIGLLWVMRSGLVLGMEAGLQIPLSTSTTSTWSLAWVPSLQRQIDSLENSVLPTIDLFRIGFVL